MKSPFAAVVYALVVASAAQGGMFTIEGDVGGPCYSGLSEGTIQIMYEGTPSFANGGVRLALIIDTPGVIEFTDASVDNTGNKWTSAQAFDLSANRVVLEAFSILTPGLPATKSLFAAVNFKFIGGFTEISLTPYGDDPLFDGKLGDASGSTQLATANTCTPPEPSTMAMVSLCVVGLALRSRS